MNSTRGNAHKTSFICCNVDEFEENESVANICLRSMKPITCALGVGVEWNLFRLWHPTYTEREKKNNIVEIINNTVSLGFLFGCISNGGILIQFHHINSKRPVQLNYVVVRTFWIEFFFVSIERSHNEIEFSACVNEYQPVNIPKICFQIAFYKNIKSVVKPFLLIDARLN